MKADDAEFTVVAKRQRTAVIAKLLLRPAGPRLRYRPGQYVLLGDPEADLVARSYSIANAPHPDGLVRLLVTQVPGGQLSGWVHDVLRTGDRVLLSGPYGAFTAAPGEADPVLLLAGGSGLAPVRALAQAALRRRTHPPVVLFFSARTPRDLIDDETGDVGTTGLLHGGRVSKGDELVDAYSDIDEATAALGTARAAGLEPRLSEIVLRLQRELFAAAADLAASPRSGRPVERAFLGAGMPQHLVGEEGTQQVPHRSNRAAAVCRGSQRARPVSSAPCSSA